MHIFYTLLADFQIGNPGLVGSFAKTQNLRSEPPLYGHVVEIPQVGGLHHLYTYKAA